MITLVFRIFAGILGAFGALNIVLVVLGGALAQYSPVELHAATTLTEAVMLFGVGAGIYVLSSGGAKAHH
ncbi:MAG: hypothetical protein HY859_06190 [Caulobacterales bacterium]|nr:hypothetical protein [Caulobacterales bacterium]